MNYFMPCKTAPDHTFYEITVQKSIHLKIQMQPSRGVLMKKCPENTQQIYRRTPIPKCDFQ